MSITATTPDQEAIITHIENAQNVTTILLSIAKYKTYPGQDKTEDQEPEHRGVEVHALGLEYTTPDQTGD